MKFGQSKFGGGNSTNYAADPNAPAEITLPPVVEATPEVKAEPADLNSTGFSLIRGPESGFSLVTIKFNPITMEAKVESVKKVSDSREEGEYYFRVKLGEYFAGQESRS